MLCSVDGEDGWFVLLLVKIQITTCVRCSANGFSYVQIVHIVFSLFPAIFLPGITLVTLTSSVFVSCFAQGFGMTTMFLPVNITYIELCLIHV